VLLRSENRGTGNIGKLADATTDSEPAQVEEKRDYDDSGTIDDTVSASHGELVRSRQSGGTRKPKPGESGTEVSVEQADLNEQVRLSNLLYP
jgi:hypothetical protein